MREALRRLPLWLSLLACCCQAAHAEIAVVMAPGAPALTRSQVASVYMGRRMDLVPLDAPENAPLRATFYRTAADADLAQVRAAWSRIMFTGRGEPPRELPDAAAVKKAVAANPRAIGYIPAADVDSTVRVVLMLP